MWLKSISYYRPKRFQNVTLWRRTRKYLYDLCWGAPPPPPQPQESHIWVSMIQQQNECACSSRVSILYSKMAALLKFPLFVFASCRGQAQIKMDKVAAFRKGSFELPPSHIVFNKKNILVAGVNLVIEVEHTLSILARITNLRSMRTHFAAVSVSVR